MSSDGSQPPFRTVSLCVVSAVLALAPARLPAQTYVLGRADFPTGTGPAAIATGDFNGDGKPDLAVADQTAGTVSTLLGKPDGTFAAKADFPVGTSPSALATGDFNGDGKLDLAVTNSGDGTVSILLGNGDGTFQAQITNGTGKAPHGVTTGDFNGDGKMDLGVANGGDSTVSVLLGNGDGSFQSQVVYGAGIASPISLVAADSRDDGNLDLVVGGTGTSILLGNGDGTFAVASVIRPGSGSDSVAAADINQDGKLDVVVADATDSIVLVLLGNGDGTFGLPAYQWQTAFDPMDLAVTDLNGDGLLDIVTANSSGSVSVLIQNTYTSGGVSYLNFAQHIDYAVTGSLLGVLTGDFNGDGRPDVAVANNTRSVASVFIGVGDGLLQIRTDLDAGDPRASSLIAGDFDGDGKADLMIPGIYFGYAPTTYLSDGDGTFNAVTATQTLLNGPSATGDFNSDGKLDLAMQAESGGIAVLPGNGDGTFGTGVTLGSASATGPLLAGDFNGDGKLDLIYYDSATVLVPGNGDGTFGSPTTISSTLSPVLAADFNGDRKLDLILQSSQGALSILPGNGDGTFGSPATVSSTTGPTTSGDFNGDGKLDLAIVENGGVTVRLGNGNGTFQPGISTTASGSLIGVDDFNRDGISDLALTNAGTFTVLYGNGDGTFRADIIGSAPAATTWGLAAGDMNGDGIKDLAVLGGDAPDYTISVLIGQAVIGLYPSTLTFPDTAVGSTSSLNVTVSNPATGQLAISSIAISSGFTQTNNCPATLASGSSCTITVSFSPSSIGAATGSVTITDSSPTSPQSIALTGLSGAEASLSPASLDFGYQSFFGPAATKTVTLTNFGNATLYVTSVSISGSGAGAYYQANTCVTLAAGSSCTLTITFPIGPASGLQIASLSIYDNAPNSPQVVSLSGTATNPVLVFSPTSLTFPTGNVGATSSPQTLTLTNTASANASFLVVGVAGADAADFGESSTCQSLPAGASCTVTVTFTPTAPGTRTASVCVTDDPAGSCVSAPTVSAALSGTGAPAPVVSFSPTSLSFAAQQVGSASPISIVTLTNAGSAALTITSVTSSGDFTAINACSGSVAVGGSCRINVIFKPIAAGARTGTLSITDNAAGSPQQVTLSGTGTIPGAELSPSSLSFAAELVGQTSAFGTVTLSNTGSAPLAIAGISFSGANAGDFAQGLAAPPPPNLCGKTLAAGSSCDIFVVFKPAAGGSRSATLTVSDNALGGSQSVSLAGTGQDFSLGPSGSSAATIAAGQSATYRVQVSSQGGFTGNVALACSGAPSASTCTIGASGILVPVGGGPVVDVTVTTTARSSAFNRGRRALPRDNSDQWPQAAWPLNRAALAALGLALTALAGLFGRGSRRRHGRSAALAFVCTALMIAMSLSLPGCGGGGNMMTTPPTSGTPAGTYTIMVTGTFTSGSANLQDSTSLTLVVQ